MLEFSAPKLDRERLAALSLSDPQTPFGLMRFRLVFTGELSADGDGAKSRVAEKWAVRNAIHPQLAELRRVHPVYRQFPRVGLISWDEAPEGKSPPNYTELIGAPKVVDGYRHVPIVRQSLSLVCGLEITLLCRQEPALITRHDIDNRIKTLLDGLSAPQPGGALVVTDPAKRPAVGPADDFYVLLEDDSLITSLAIHTERYLCGPHAPDTAVLAFIDVTVKVAQIMWANIGFLGI